jgi:multidrug transporter EmrE-like cation transporter
MNLVLLIAASALFAGGGLFMKLSDGLTKLLPSIVLFVFFCAGAACQTVAMRRADMGVVYIFVLGLEAVLAMLLSVLVLGERANASRIAAVVLVVAGIALLRRT